jgi:hypothetical protein
MATVYTPPVFPEPFGPVWLSLNTLQFNFGPWAIAPPTTTFGPL